MNLSKLGSILRKKWQNINVQLWYDSEQNSDGQGFRTANMDNFEYLEI